MSDRYFYERAYWALRRSFAGPQKPAIADTVAVSAETSSPSPSKEDPLDPGKLPTKPPAAVGVDEASKVHQYKKESSSQQAP